MSDDERCDECAEILYAAGERVPAGVYKQLDSSHQVIFDQEGVLPGGMDGHATIYVGIRNTWAQIQRDSKG